MLFKVIKIVNSTTVKIFPKWQWNDLSGNLIGIRNLKEMNLQNCDDCERLKSLTLNKSVEFRYPEYVHHKKLLCDLILLEEEN
ncbi:hypothetical protein ACFLYJ_01390 [Candidatus Cloacimonadota bacterium]